MRHNGRPAVPASSLAPSVLSLYPGERPMVACPDCGRWRVLRRGMLAPHRADDGVSRCPGSAQRIRLDESPGQWLTRLDVAQREASTRSGHWTYRRTSPPGGRKLVRATPSAPTAPPVFRIPLAP